MKVGTPGSGLMGANLGAIFARAGHDVLFSYARREKKLERLARDVRKTIRAGPPPRGLAVPPDPAVAYSTPGGSGGGRAAGARRW
jgi:NAD(P)-dependent dehydrogenase (short-subunit alcohol dehydrogenase family)